MFLMLYTALVIKAVNLAYEAHHGQKDKVGLPYFLHPFHVAERMDDEKEVCVALLHDVLEDTTVSLDELKHIFPVEVTDALQLLTHDDKVDYFEYIKALSHNPLAKKVKLADLEHNLDIRRIPEFNSEALKGYYFRIEKYKKSYGYSYE